MVTRTPCLFKMRNDLDSEDSRGSCYSYDSRRHDDDDESVDDSIGRKRDKQFNHKGKQGQKEVDEHDDRENKIALAEFSNYESTIKFGLRTTKQTMPSIFHIRRKGTRLIITKGEEKMISYVSRIPSQHQGVTTITTKMANGML